MCARRGRQAITGRVIQGFFIGGTMRAPVQCAGATGAASARPGPPSAFAGRAPAVQARVAPGRPPPAHQPSASVAQRFGGGGTFEIDPAQVGLARGGGSPLPQAVLAKMEAAFGADFSAVRVHVGPQASRIGAVAFTTGNDLYFAPGRYQPESVQGQQLIGHELAHVIQQRQGRVRAPGSGVAVVQDRALEAEADRLGMRAAAHRVAVQAKPAPGHRHLPAPGRPAMPIQRARSSRSTLDLRDTDVHDIPGFHTMGLESVGGSGGDFDYFTGTGSLGEQAKAFAHGVGNMLSGQGRWANLLWFTHRSKDSGRVSIDPRHRAPGNYNPTGGTSATDYLSQSRSGHHQLRGLNAFGVSYHWNHLVASSLGGDNGEDNIVSASKWANGEMLAIEGKLKSLCEAGHRLDVRVRATLAWGSEHQAENLTYDVFAGGGPLLFTRDIDARRAVPLTKSERQAIADALDEAVADYDSDGINWFHRQIESL
jgi:Domain of unknown function (DUF4157)/DNA/RNA non-specific endonuclease